MLERHRKENGKIPVVLVGDFNLPKITVPRWQDFTRNFFKVQQGEIARCDEESPHEHELELDRQFLIYLRALRDNHDPVLFRQHIERPTYKHGSKQRLLDLLLSTNDVIIEERRPITPRGSPVQDNNFHVVFTDKNTNYHYTILFSVSKKL